LQNKNRFGQAAKEKEKGKRLSILRASALGVNLTSS